MGDCQFCWPQCRGECLLIVQVCLALVSLGLWELSCILALSLPEPEEVHLYRRNTAPWQHLFHHTGRLSLTLFPLMDRFSIFCLFVSFLLLFSFFPPLQMQLNKYNPGISHPWYLPEHICISYSKTCLHDAAATRGNRKNLIFASRCFYLQTLTNWSPR